jgi:cytidylate kinase
MAVVTLTGHLGAMGNVANFVAVGLSYRLVERELVEQAAGALGWSEEQAREFDERAGGFGRWLAEVVQRFTISSATTSDLIGAYALSYGEAAGYLASESERYLRALCSAMNAFADEGDVVIVGRGGQALFASRLDAVHIRVMCPPEIRARRVATRHGIEASAARAMVDKSDRQREAWHSKYFGIDYQSPFHYDLVVNTGRLSDPHAARLIIETVHSEIQLAAR